ncbi:P-loop NTPase fold protein [Pedobacter sp. GR22-10]|uniref:P-loop NTPase fold protein n=1 Tax=Pedobacter sp. GR22-10 TaxID=2994472 RepID=UPI0022481B1F|nr:P-loop NTPase fold protein [Pedobacter sp. GR22-10]MCX2432190.1 P-loop NTPase fold protein [Pedobacter sp. GR22-10]
MINVNLLASGQSEILRILNHSFQTGKEKTLISMPPGTGKTLIVTAFLENIARNLEKRDLILVIATNRAIKEQMIQVFSEHIPLPILDLTNKRESELPAIMVLTEKELEDLQGALDFIRRPKFCLLLVEKINPKVSEQLFKALTRFKDLPQIAFTNDNVPSDYFGHPSFIYSYAEAIKDGRLAPMQIQNISLGLNEMQLSVRKLLNGTTDDESEIFEIKDNVALEAYINTVCKDLLERITSGKTLIVSPGIVHAEAVSRALNEISGSLVSAVIHSRVPKEEVKAILDDFNSEQNSINILVIIRMNFAIATNKIQNVALLRRYINPSSLKTILALAQRTYPQKNSVRILDYADNSKVFKQVFMDSGIETSIEPVQVPRTHLSESEIRFRDKKNIDPVLAADEIAKELSQIIEIIPGEQGSMIGIFGPWGRGKTFLMDLIWKELVKTDKFIKVDFHAWKYQDTPATWAYLYEKLVERYFDDETDKSLIKKSIKSLWRRLRLNWKRHKVGPILKLLGVTFVGIVASLIIDSFLPTGLKSKNSYYDILKFPAATTVIIFAIIKSLKKDYSSKANEIFNKYTTKHSFSDQLGLQAEIQKETSQLLKCWIPEKLTAHKKIVLFIDDIDRCSETKVIQIIDALRVLLEDIQIAERIVIVAAVDERILKLAIKNKYNSLLSIEEKDEKEHRKRLNKITEEYMDKLFISGIKLGVLSMEERDDFILSLTKADRDETASLKSLEKIIEKEWKNEESRMSDNLRQALIDHEIEVHQETQYNEQLEMEQYLEEDYHSKYIDSSKPLEPSNAQINKGRLAPEEVDILRYATSLYTDATPRQIRIFYYRYLIAKNLLEKRYRSLKRTNIWIEIENSMIVTKLIIKYTLTTEDQSLETHLATILKAKNTVSEIALLADTKVDTVDYRELLKVLNLVIAY